MYLLERELPIELLGQGASVWIALFFFFFFFFRLSSAHRQVRPDPLSSRLRMRWGTNARLRLIHDCDVVPPGLTSLLPNVISSTADDDLAWRLRGTYRLLLRPSDARRKTSESAGYSGPSHNWFYVLACGVGAFIIGIFHVMTTPSSKPCVPRRRFSDTRKHPSRNAGMGGRRSTADTHMSSSRAARDRRHLPSAASVEG